MVVGGAIATTTALATARAGTSVKAAIIKATEGLEARATTCLAYSWSPSLSEAEVGEACF